MKTLFAVVLVAAIGLAAAPVLADGPTCTEVCDSQYNECMSWANGVLQQCLESARNMTQRKACYAGYGIRSLTCGKSLNICVDGCTQ